ncbi:hypothetical protein [Stutzerimonas nitrititolerans]|uniref:hypothetical protein n=1 Tax=Stutzerimonas nitrititolerans TaxID=2482751 RepID=UPI00289A478F|nr:hypothetical protein [Stutzerimonas nitrititolerans]
MPQLIDYIDAIARKKNRDVLYVVFEPVPGSTKDVLSWAEYFDWENHTSRQAIIHWLEENGIAWKPCAGFAKVNHIPSYRGQIYIDLPFDRSLAAYKQLESFLENLDGSMRLPGATFAYLPLEMAMKNAEHDEKGFWDRWADVFL